MPGPSTEDWPRWVWDNDLTKLPDGDYEILEEEKTITTRGRECTFRVRVLVEPVCSQV